MVLRRRRQRGRVGNGIGMSWETTDVMSADTTDVLAADTTDVFPADTTHVLPADSPCGRIREAATHILGFGRENNGIFPWKAGFCYETFRYYAALDIVRFCGPGYGYPWAWWL